MQLANETEARAVEQLSLGARDAAKAIGISERSLWSLTAENVIPHLRIGRRVLYPVDGLREWIAARSHGGAV